MRLLIFLTLAAAQGACAVFGGGGVEKNRAVWRASGIDDYRMVIILKKTGHATPSGKYVVMVTDGVARSVKRAEDPEGAEQLGGTLRFGQFVTMDGIFDHIESMEKEKDWGWSAKETVYDRTFGYPKKVSLDAARVNDEELMFEVLEFERK